MPHTAAYTLGHIQSALDKDAQVLARVLEAIGFALETDHPVPKTFLASRTGIELWLIRQTLDKYPRVSKLLAEAQKNCGNYERRLTMTRGHDMVAAAADHQDKLVARDAVAAIEAAVKSKRSIKREELWRSLKIDDEWLSRVFQKFPPLHVLASLAADPEFVRLRTSDLEAMIEGLKTILK